MKNDIYSQIDNNKRKTFFIMFGFVVFITTLTWLFAYTLGGKEAIVFFVPLAVLISVISSIISYYNSDKIAIATSGAKPAKKEQFSNLHATVENLSIVAGIPKPKIYYINDSAPNAFATGRDPKHAVIVVTTGLLDKLNKVELEGVIAHEMAHIKNFDIRLMSIVAVLVGLVVILADWFLRANFFKNRDSKSTPLLFLAIVMSLLAPVFLELVKLAISRNREYLADSTGAYFTRYPKGLADALVKISGDKEKLEAANRGTAHMYISDPFKRKASNMFSTHPPVEERIKRLRAM